VYPAVHQSQHHILSGSQLPWEIGIFISGRWNSKMGKERKAGMGMTIGKCPVKVIMLFIACPLCHNSL